MRLAAKEVLQRHGLLARRGAVLRNTARRACRVRWVVSSAAAGEERQFTIVHFNDVYNIEPRVVEPVGGAARFVHAVKSFAHLQPLVLFSGDCLNPSLLSAFTRGEQMVPVLNAAGVAAAVVGNHDCDFGLKVLTAHMAACHFPWLLSNVLDRATGAPLAGAARSLVLEWGGVRVGLVGLVEREWLLTIPSLDEADTHYLDFRTEGRRLARQLLAEGADLVVALTHMRTPNDLALASDVPEIGLVLGGHDHHFAVCPAPGTGTLVIKSGTDFRELSVITVTLPPAPPAETSGGGSGGGGSISSSSGGPARPGVSWQRVEVTSSVEEDPEIAAVVRHYQELMGDKLWEPLGWSHTDLDARFDTVRTGESNVGNLFADIMRISLGADAALLNGGTVRSDQEHGAGQLMMRDFVSLLPFVDELVLLELGAAELVSALETGVGSWPVKEGRFLQVSGISFEFDPAQAPGRRVVPGSVRVAGAALDPARRYRVATKAYLRGGKDGFACLRDAPILVDGETAPRLATLVQYLLMRIEALNEGIRRAGDAESDSEGEGQLAAGAAASASSSSGGGADEGVGALGAGPGDAPRSSIAREALLQPEPCQHGLDCLYFFDRSRRKHGIAPKVEGRIVRRGAEAPAPGTPAQAALQAGPL